MYRYNISDTNYSSLMNDKINRYNKLLRQAEILNMENKGEPTREEGKCYKDIVEVCNEIINLNLNSRATANLWTERRKIYEAEAIRIARRLAPPKAQEESETQVNGKPVGKTGTVKKDSQGYSTTSSGFKTKNACKEVPAETIEKWYKGKPKNTLDNVVGMGEAKKLLLSKAGNLGWDKLNKALNISPVQSFFFYGPPGTGKTYLIEAFASTMMEKGYKFLHLVGGDIHASLVGVAEKTVQILFQEAVDNAPCIIFIDEIENVFVNRKMKNVEGHEKRLNAAFLEAYNYMKNSEKPVIFMGATNFPSMVDEAMLDRITLVPIPLPDEDVRKAYFERQLEGLSFEEGYSCADMAEATDNHSFRDMGRLVEYIRDLLRLKAIDSVKDANAAGADHSEADASAADAVLSGKLQITKALFDQAQEVLPPSSKADSRAELEAFEAKVKGLTM